MSLLAAVRSTGALWFVPVLFALSTVMPILNAVVRTGYAVADISSASIALAYAGPLLSGFTAFAFRGRVGFHRTLRGRRSGGVLLLAAGWPLLIGGPLVVCAAVLVTARVVPLDGVAWSLLAADFMVLLACAMLGVVFAWALPVVMSVPLVVVLCFLWINYLPAHDSPLVHYMAPTVDGFAQSAQPATLGIAGVLVLAGTVCAGALLCVGRRSWDTTSRLRAVPMALAVPWGAAGLSAAFLQLSSSPLNLMVVEPRTTPLECSASEGIEVCLWPEAAERARQVAAIASEMNDPLSRWGLPTITRIGQGGLRAGSVDIESSESLSDDLLRYSIARGYLRSTVGCHDVTGRPAETRVAVLTLASGAPTTDRDLREEFSSETLQAAMGVLRESKTPGEIGRWYADGAAEIRCASL